MKVILFTLIFGLSLLVEGCGPQEKLDLGEKFELLNKKFPEADYDRMKDLVESFDPPPKIVPVSFNLNLEGENGFKLFFLEAIVIGNQNLPGEIIIGGRKSSLRDLKRERSETEVKVLGEKVSIKTLVALVGPKNFSLFLEGEKPMQIRKKGGEEDIVLINSDPDWAKVDLNQNSGVQIVTIKSKNLSVVRDAK